MSRGLTVTVPSPADLAARVPDLGLLLHACVHAGASVNFVLPFSQQDGCAFWRAKALPAVQAGRRVLWIAEDAGRLAGTVQLDHDTPPNQPHRAEVTKLLVHPHFRRRGIARALMVELERHASRVGRTLITLDTRTGDAAERLYASLGYATVGVIPGYCRDPATNRLDSTTVMYKAL